VVGVFLLVVTLAIAFTGYLLPWDQKGYWATTVATELLSSTPILGADGPGSLVGADRDLRAALLGGPSVGPATLTRFYALHCFILPLLGGLGMALHFWRVRKDGISEPL
jgi:quinol-cytochrome oxidoreductase complex cytochrome b subunit